MTTDLSAHDEPHVGSSSSTINSLRAAVLGANDGIVSVAALVVGIAAADPSAHVLAAGVAGLLAGALSMAAGEYVSVSTQRDTEQALLAKERHELQNEPEKELEELTGLYEAKGLSRQTAEQVAKELTAHDAFGAHTETELRIDPNNLTSPWRAAAASAAAFTVGAVIPILAITLPPLSLRIPVTFAAVLCALILTGALSAYAGGASKRKAALRVVVGGVLAMAITFGVGKLFGIASV